MTVIAYRNGTLAADRMACDGNVIHGYRKKVFSFEGKIGAACGPSQDCVAFRIWLEGGAQPTLDENFTAIVAGPDGVAEQYDNKLIPFILEADYFAEGDGYQVALGAMFMGASAEEAVRAACAHVLGCGGGIDVVSLDDLK